MFVKKECLFVLVFISLSNFCFSQNIQGESIGLENLDSCRHENHLRVTYLWGFAGTSFVYDLKYDKSKVDADIIFLAFMKEKRSLNGVTIKLDSIIYKKLPFEAVNHNSIAEDVENIMDCQSDSNMGNIEYVSIHPNQIVIESISSNQYYSEKVNLSSHLEVCKTQIAKKVFERLKSSRQYFFYERAFIDNLPPGNYSEGVIQFMVLNKFLLEGGGTPASNE